MQKLETCYHCYIILYTNLAIPNEDSIHLHLHGRHCLYTRCINPESSASRERRTDAKRATSVRITGTNDLYLTHIIATNKYGSCKLQIKLKQCPVNERGQLALHSSRRGVSQYNVLRHGKGRNLGRCLDSLGKKF